MNWKAIIIPSAYFALFAVSAFVMFWWERRKRGANVPFGKDLRLLRAAGETHLKAVRRIDEDFLSVWLLAGLGPCLAGIILLEVTAWLKDWWLWAGVGLTLAGFALAFGLAARWLQERLTRRREHYVASFGERVVADYLEPLKASGWRVFHDVPGETGRERFNIDHVAIGPGGVYAIETRTRLKAGAREGRADFKVFFDGEQLDWPWGEDRYGIDTATGNAKWLKNWIVRTTGVLTDVTPVLALPGWCVEAPAHAALRVVNPSWLPEIVEVTGPVALSGKQIELCARMVEQRCRDVEY